MALIENKKYTTIIGIDPGSKGAIAVYETKYKRSYKNGAVYVYSFKGEYNKQIIKTVLSLSSGSNTIAFVEKVHSMPRQGVKSMFTFGKNYGYILGMLDMCDINVYDVFPTSWKQEFDLTNKDKQASIDKAKELFPDISLLPTNRSRVECDGMAEALLILEYGRRLYDKKKKK